MLTILKMRIKDFLVGGLALVLFISILFSLIGGFGLLVTDYEYAIRPIFKWTFWVSLILIAVFEVIIFAQNLFLVFYYVKKWQLPKQEIIEAAFILDMKNLEKYTKDEFLQERDKKRLDRKINKIAANVAESIMKNFRSYM